MAELKAELTENILPFWIHHAYDPKNGGIYGSLDNQNRGDSQENRSIVMSARHLWAYSAASNFLDTHRQLFEQDSGRHGYRDTADSIYRYIDHYDDKEFGGVYWSVEPDGKPADMRKQIYGEAFAIYGLSEYARTITQESVTADGILQRIDAFTQAVKIFNVLEKRARDWEHGGYCEALGRNWEPINDTKLSAVDIDCDKSMNTNLHVLEALSNLYRACKAFEPMIVQQQKAHVESQIQTLEQQISDMHKAPQQKLEQERPDLQEIQQRIQELQSQRQMLEQQESECEYCWQESQVQKPQHREIQLESQIQKLWQRELQLRAWLRKLRRQNPELEAQIQRLQYQESLLESQMKELRRQESGQQKFQRQQSGLALWQQKFQQEELEIRKQLKRVQHDESEQELWVQKSQQQMRDHESHLQEIREQRSNRGLELRELQRQKPERELQLESRLQQLQQRALILQKVQQQDPELDMTSQLQDIHDQESEVKSEQQALQSRKPELDSQLEDLERQELNQELQLQQLQKRVAGFELQLHQLQLQEDALKLGLEQLQQEQALLDAAEIGTQVKKALESLITVTKDHIFGADNHLKLFFNNDWTVTSDIVSFGHDIEASWLLWEAAELTGNEELQRTIRPLVIQVADTALVEGFEWSDEWGALDNEIKNGTRDKTRIWWCQAEAMVGFFNAWQLTGESRFREAVIKQWKWIKKYQKDPSGGDWFWAVSAEGTADRDKPKGGNWKTPYHNARSCMELIGRMHDMTTPSTT
ncbi:MAG: AGE family epimerase/isomerase [Treponema sp.]|nr:AGE family epimerase/isomerase [Treponema sp.]